MRALVALAVLVAPVAAQTGQANVATGQTVQQAPGVHYRAGGLHRFLLGPEYRELWVTSVTVPVLDLDSLTGLRALGRTGGQETKTLKLGASDGHQFFWRSIDKDPSLALPPELRGTVAGRVVQDQTSSANPLAPLVVARLITAAGVLHTTPVLVALPDDPRLGEFRADFGGLMGFMEERVGGSGPAAHWHGAAEIIDGDSLFDLVNRSSDDQVDPRAFLVARLFDVFIGDWDRHRDQWRWARFGDSQPRRWLPVPLDRDQAFVKYDGLLLSIARQSVPQLVNYGPDYADMAGQTWNGRELDRRFLVSLPRPVWDSVALALQTALSDSVITDAVGALPPEHFALVGTRLKAWLTHRRNALPKAAGRFYDLLAGQVDVHGTDGPDVASATHAPDGTLTVALSKASRASLPYFERRFEPGKTSEVRLFLGSGDDTAIVRGEGGGVLLRVLGDSGSDRLLDSSRSGRNRFYDADAGPEREKGGPEIDRRPYSPPPSANPHELPPRDWGHRWQPLTWASFGPDLGFFIGGGRSLTTYGFRKYPFSSRHRLRAGFATGPPSYRVDYLGEFHRENSGVSVELFAKASGIEVTRFHGFGNETPLGGSDAFHRVNQGQFSFSPSLSLPLASRLVLVVGPTVKYVTTDRDPGRFLATLNPYGSGKFGAVGAEASLRLDTRNRGTAATRGVAIEVSGVVHPAWWDAREAYGKAHGEAAVYLSPPAPLDPTLSLRIGGEKLWGDYPFFDAAFIGSRQTVRLGREQRYAGDASAYGSAELRLALARTVLVVPTDLGVFGLADAGRVYYAPESSTVWHTAFGGGVWLSFFTRANTLSAAIAASDERTAIYVQAGFGI